MERPHPRRQLAEWVNQGGFNFRAQEVGVGFQEIFLGPACGNETLDQVHSQHRAYNMRFAPQDIGKGYNKGTRFGCGGRDFGHVAKGANSRQGSRGMYNCAERWEGALVRKSIGWGLLCLVFLGLSPSASSSSRLACGLLTLEVIPKGSTTLLDGEILGENIWLISVMPGSHTLEVRKSGFKSYARDFDLNPGARLRLAVNLERVSP
jgi:hypothetical protein